jgi:hypothetical protein
MKKKVIVNAMGKQITIDNPSDINIVLKDKGCKPFKFKVQINKRGTRRLAGAFKRISGDFK